MASKRVESGLKQNEDLMGKIEPAELIYFFFFLESSRIFMIYYNNKKKKRIGAVCD